MPPSIKQKTHKGIKKRFKVTATGKVVHKRCGSSHLNSHKSGERIRKLRKKKVLASPAVARKLRRALGVREGARPHAPRSGEREAAEAPAAAAPEAVAGSDSPTT
jgi:large subunit ribosomal protein L35